MTDLFAYTFATDLSLAELAARLAGGPWRWIERDGERWGDYLATVGVPGAIVKLIVDEPGPGTGAINVRFASTDPDAAAQLAALRRTLEQAVLPAIGARAVAAAAYLE